jgi:hypothetical protein
VELLANFVQKSVETTLEKKKSDFSKIFQTRKKLDSESTDFLFRFFLFFEDVADFIPFFKKRNAIELHFQIFHKNILQN